MSAPPRAVADAVRRRFLRLSLAGVVVWGLLGAGVGYLGGGSSAAAWLGTVFAVLLTVVLILIYRVFRSS